MERKVSSTIAKGPEARLELLFSRLEKLEKASKSDKYWDMAVKALVPISVILAGWMIGAEVRLRTIEANRFTNSDGATLDRRISIIEERMATKRNLDATERRILAQLPPDWLKNDMKKIEALLKEHSERLRSIETKLAKVK